MTKEEARKMCDLFHENSFTYETGMGRTADTYDGKPNGFVLRLREQFPDFNWRIIMDRSHDRTRWAVTVDDDDKREHYVAESKYPDLPNTCIHCGKTAEELGVKERKEYDRD